MRRRKQIRLKEYDYSLPGGYFVTVCTKERKEIFGEMRRNEYGNIVQSCWDELPLHYPTIQLDEFLIMPNYIRGIIIITDQPGRDVQLNIPTEDYHSRISPKPGSISVMLRTFKAAVTMEYREKGYKDFSWQSRFCDHVVRNEKSLHRIREYIRTNPQQWIWNKENARRYGLDRFDDWLIEEGQHRIPEGRDS